MKIGIICGKTSEECLDKQIVKKIPKKYKINGSIHTDVALAYIIKEKFPDIQVDIILPKDISNARLQKNDINIPVGYDIINAINDDPYIKKFSGKDGIDKLDKIYQNKKNKIFPSYEFMAFIWDKKKYLQVFQKHKIPISPTIFIKDNVQPKKLLQQVQKYKWKDFIIKPIGGTTSFGLGLFKLSDCLKDLSSLKEYFEENNESYEEYLVQELIIGFREYGEIKSFWIDGKYSYAVNIIDRGETDYKVQEIIDPKVVQQITKLGERVMKVIPKISFNRKKTIPAMVRIDFTCCLHNKKFSPSNYFVNEIESDIAGTYINFKNIKYPMLEVMADTYVKKAKELGIK
jgi:glutathione synthase/RimK-type ligase-like ATP-grasp enzyme